MKTAASQNNGTGLIAFLRRHPWLTAALTLVLLLGALYVLVEWRAEQRWQRYAKAARARGAKLYYADLVRPEIPEDQNFAELPMLKKALAGGENEPPFKLPKWPRARPATGGRPASTYDDIPPTLGSASKGDKTNWKEWRDYFQAVGFVTETSSDPAWDVLRALDHYAPQFQQWSEWRTTRPQCRFPVDPVKGDTIPINLFTHVALMFDLRLSAHLTVRDPAAAYADFQDGLQVARVLQGAPSLVNGVMRVGILRFLVEAMANGFRDHVWKDAELQKIQADLDALRLWEDYRDGMEATRASLNVEAEKLMNIPMRERFHMDGPYQFVLMVQRWRWVSPFMPRSVFRDNELRLNQYVDELTVESRGAGATFELDRKTPSAPANLTSSYDQQYYFLSGLIGDSFGTVERQYIRLQILLDQARLACALERFRLARGAYPDALAELVPEFIPVLPIDIYAQAPYRYRRIGTTSFQLYSVGENRKDDGGVVVVPPRSGPPQGDIVWPFARPWNND